MAIAPCNHSEIQTGAGWCAGRFNPIRSGIVGLRGLLATASRRSEIRVKAVISLTSPGDSSFFFFHTNSRTPWCDFSSELSHSR